MFVKIFMVGSVIRFHFCKSDVLTVEGHPRSLMLVPFKLFDREIIFEVFQPMWSRYLNVTGRQIDRQTDGRTDDMQSHNRAMCSSITR